MQIQHFSTLIEQDASTHLMYVMNCVLPHHCADVTESNGLRGDMLLLIPGTTGIPYTPWKLQSSNQLFIFVSKNREIINFRLFNPHFCAISGPFASDNYLTLPVAKFEHVFHNVSHMFDTRWSSEETQQQKVCILG